MEIIIRTYLLRLLWELCKIRYRKLLVHCLVQIEWQVLLLFELGVGNTGSVTTSYLTLGRLTLISSLQRGAFSGSLTQMLSEIRKGMYMMYDDWTGWKLSWTWEFFPTLRHSNSKFVKHPKPGKPNIGLILSVSHQFATSGGYSLIFFSAPAFSYSSFPCSSSS